MTDLHGADPSAPRLESNLDFVTGSAVYDLVSDPTLWVHRRVETVEFLNPMTFQRSIRVEFTPPPTGEQEGHRPPYQCIPLAVLSKDRRIMELFDESGQAVPCLTKTENELLATAVLAVAARSVLPQPERDVLPFQLLGDLRDICTWRTEDALRAFRKFLSTPGYPWPLISRSDEFRAIAQSLAQGYLFIAVVPDEPGRRRILELRYRETLRWQRAPVLQRWGWTPMPFGFSTPGIVETPAYHFIAVAPPGLEIVKGAIWDHAKPEDFELKDFSLDGGSRVHLYARDERGPLDARAWIWVGVARPGLLRAAAATSLLSTILLLVILLRITIENAAPAATIGVLLAIPSAISLFIVRPGENPFTSEILKGLRGVIAVSGLFSFIAALVTALGLAGTTLRWTWGGIAAGAACCCAILGIAYVRSGLPISLEGDEEA